MNRRSFVQGCGAAVALSLLPRRAFAAPTWENLLILVELKGGNDGLNTVVPYADPLYTQLRPVLAIPRDQVLQLDEHVGLHPALAPLLPLWKAKELAIVEGLGYAAPNLSHFRSIEIWDTASRSDEIIENGWLARLFSKVTPPDSFAAHGAVVGAPELGPFAGDWRTLALDEGFAQRARGMEPQPGHGNAALEHILKVEREIAHAAARLGTPRTFTTQFPNHPFGKSMRTVAQVAANPAGVAAVRVTLSGFDTHHNQLAAQARVLTQLGEGLAALRSALIEANRWSSTLIATYAEFGRRAKQNQSGGTDHGTANAHFVLGGRVRGGLHGARPSLEHLDGNGNLVHTVDFRALYATIAERWWRCPDATVDGARPLDQLLNT